MQDKTELDVVDVLATSDHVTEEPIDLKAAAEVIMMEELNTYMPEPAPGLRQSGRDRNQERDRAAVLLNLQYMREIRDALQLLTTEYQFDKWLFKEPEPDEYDPSKLVQHEEPEPDTEIAT